MATGFSWVLFLENNQRRVQYPSPKAYVGVPALRPSPLFGSSTPALSWLPIIFSSSIFMSRVLISPLTQLGSKAHQSLQPQLQLPGFYFFLSLLFGTIPTQVKSNMSPPLTCRSNPAFCTSTSRAPSSWRKRHHRVDLSHFKSITANPRGPWAMPATSTFPWSIHFPALSDDYFTTFPFSTNSSTSLHILPSPRH